jgi:hypothetical protein
MSVIQYSFQHSIATDGLGVNFTGVSLEELAAKIDASPTYDFVARRPGYLVVVFTQTDQSFTIKTDPDNPDGGRFIGPLDQGDLARMFQQVLLSLGYGQIRPAGIPVRPERVAS